MFEDSLPQSLYEACKSLFQKSGGYRIEEQENITKALFTAATYHRDQVRKSGEPYLLHPLQVALTLIFVKADGITIQAALLHDTLEDTELKPESLQQEFGMEVYSIVEAVTHQPMFSTKEFFEKVYTKSKNDPRIAALKLADQCMNHLHHSQRVFTPAKHLEHLEEFQHFYLEQLATIPEIPKEILRMAERIESDSRSHYHQRTNTSL